MAAMPSGVAALPSPSRLAVMLSDMDFFAAGSGRALKSIPSGFCKSLFRAFVIPHLSATAISPPHSAIAPARSMQSETALPHPVSAAADTSPVSPV